jgi:hypothetical protein
MWSRRRTLGELYLGVGNQRRRDARAACLGRDEKLIQLLTLENAETDRRAKWTGDADVRECGLQPLAKAVERAEAGQLRRRQRRMGFVPDVMPQPREVIDLGGLGRSHLHH